MDFLLTFFSFFSLKKGARGFDSELIIVDEGNFVKTDVYLQTLFPVCQQKGTILIILTTPLGLDNETSRLFDTRNALGEHIIKTVRIGASCEACRKARVLCTHNENAKGEGLSSKKRAAFMPFYESQMHVAMREFTGEPGDAGRIMFKNEWLLELSARKEHPINNVAGFILVGIDPAQGGGCEWGLCACYFDHIANVQVIIHMDACRLDDVSNTGIMLFLKASIDSIRYKCSYFQKIPILIACEAAPCVIAENIASILDGLLKKNEMYNVHMMHELPNNRPGVPKTHENTQRMVAYGQTLLENNQVVFSELFGTNTPTASGNDEECIKAKFIKQLHNVQRKPKATVRKDGVITYRLDGKSGGINDDLFVAWCMLLWWYFSIMGEKAEKYQHIVGSTKRAISLGGSLTMDAATGRNKFAEKRRLETSHRFEEAPVDSSTGELIPLSQLHHQNREQTLKKTRYNEYNPDDQIF